nr:glycosyltransferase family 4 protein [uncultured Psychroserpens sp.]
MKILILYTYNKGYLSSFFFELSAKLKSEGHDVINFSLKHRERTFLKENVSIIIKNKGGYMSNYLKILKLIKAHKPDVILSNFSYVNPSLLFGKFFGIKKNIVWFHSLNNQMKPSKSNLFIKEQFLKLADVVVANSFLTEKELLKIYKIPQKKLQVVPFWTNISGENTVLTEPKFIENSAMLNIGCPGRLTAHKNQKVVIEAASRLKESSKGNFQLYFAGRGEDYDNLKKMSERLNLLDQVTFVEHLSAEDMVTFYKEMDVIVLPSLDEAFGLVFIEAISLGVPVIVSSKFGALTFINDSEFNLDDFTFNPESAVDLENKLRAYFNNSNMTSSYFKSLYDKTFNKEEIYKLVKNVLTTTT